MINESQLELALKNSWSKKTSSDPQKWSKNNSAWGQCAVSSLIINDYLGGEIVWAEVILPDKREVSHYFNKINNIEKDFTISQFPKGTLIPKGNPKTNGFNSTREYILSYPLTQKRYILLKERVKDFLQT